MKEKAVLSQHLPSLIKGIIKSCGLLRVRLRCFKTKQKNPLWYND